MGNRASTKFAEEIDLFHFFLKVNGGGGRAHHRLHPHVKEKKLKLQYPTVTARLHAEIDEKITIFF